MQAKAETTEGHGGTGVGGGLGRPSSWPDPRGTVNPALRYMRAKTAMLNAQADMAEAWVEMTREERMLCESPVWNRRNAV